MCFIVPLSLKCLPLSLSLSVCNVCVYAYVCVQLGVCIIDEESLVLCECAYNSEGVSISEGMEGTVQHTL